LFINHLLGINSNPVGRRHSSATREELREVEAFLGQVLRPADTMAERSTRLPMPLAA
jgi:hypothetical protein